MNTVTIALTRYNEPNELLQANLESIASQENVRAFVFVLDQNAYQETRLLCESLSSDNVVFKYCVIPARGCAYARNIAIDHCATDILLWTDPDIILPSDWAFFLSQAFLDLGCSVVGSRIIPLWQREPRWYMKSGVMADQYSLIDLGMECQQTDRIVGGSMGINITGLGSQAYFCEHLGRQGGTLLGGVDSEFCQRVIQKGFRVFYVGQKAAMHQITANKMKLTWIAKKFYFGGVSRGMLGGMPRLICKKMAISDYFILIAFAPFYLWGYIRGIMKKERRIT